MRRVILIALLMAGCGGGGGPSPPPPDNVPRSEVLHWTQPWVFADNTAMPRSAVSRWDIFCSPVPSFQDNDIIASVDIRSADNLAFNLFAMRTYGLWPGPDGKFISVRCVGIDNQQSAFAEPILWTE